MRKSVILSVVKGLLLGVFYWYRTSNIQTAIECGVVTIVVSLLIDFIISRVKIKN